VYDHLHGMLGEASDKNVRLWVCITKMDKFTNQDLVIKRITALLRLDALGTCGWYLKCSVNIYATSVFRPATARCPGHLRLVLASLF